MNKLRFVSCLVLLFASSALCLQAQSPNAAPEPAQLLAGKAAAASNDDPTHPAPGERNPRYRINRSDVLMISFALSPEFNQKVTVQPDGYITLQSAGSLSVMGMT